MVFFFNDTATTEIYTLSLHDALPIFRRPRTPGPRHQPCLIETEPSGLTTPSTAIPRQGAGTRAQTPARSEEHTSELQSRQYLVCRLLLEKKKNDANVNKTFALILSLL